MATHNVSTFYNSPHPLILAESPLRPFFHEVHNKCVILRGISGRILVECNEITFYPDEAGYQSQAYRDDVEEQGEPWSSWVINEDTPLLLELAQALESPFRIEIDLRHPVELPHEEGWTFEQETEWLRQMALRERAATIEIWMGDTKDVSPYADLIHGFYEIMRIPPWG